MRKGSLFIFLYFVAIINVIVTAQTDYDNDYPETNDENEENEEIDNEDEKANYTQEDLYGLMDHLFSQYKPEVRPTYRGEATYLYISLYLLTIITLDEKNQELHSSVVLEAFWKDVYLSWNASNYANIEYVLYPQKNVWLPDCVIDNSVESQKYLGFDQNKVIIYNDGWVYWKPIVVTRTGCDIDVTYYPFDTQTCVIIIGTWMSDEDQIDVDPDRDANGFDLSFYSQSGTWELVSTHLEILPNYGDRTRIGFWMKLRRRRLYYILNILVPVIFLSFTASMVFFLPADAGEKVGMGITVLLAYAVYLTIISDNMPQTSLQVSLLAVYLAMLLGLTALGVVLAVVVLHLHHKPAEHRIGRRTAAVTRRLRRLLRFRPVPASSGTGEQSIASDEGSCEVNTSTEALAVVFSPRGNQPGIAGKVAAPLRNIPATTVVEELTWPKVAETMDRLLFICSCILIVGINVVFLSIIATGDG